MSIFDIECNPLVDYYENQKIICPITQDEIKECGITCNGKIFDYQSIMEWFKISDKDPLTNLPFKNKHVVKCYISELHVSGVKKLAEEIAMKNKFTIEHDTWKNYNAFKNICKRNELMFVNDSESALAHRYFQNYRSIFHTNKMSCISGLELSNAIRENMNVHVEIQHCTFTKVIFVNCIFREVIYKTNFFNCIFINCEFHQIPYFYECYLNIKFSNCSFSTKNKKECFKNIELVDDIMVGVGNNTHCIVSYDLRPRNPMDYFPETASIQERIDAIIGTEILG